MLHVVVLAAGQGTRMRSSRPKVLHLAGGLTLLGRVIRVAGTLNPTSTTVVVGHMADIVGRVSESLGCQVALQAEQRGTAHALLQARESLRAASGTLLLLSGDVPLLSRNTLEALLQRHAESEAAATVLTAAVDSPTGYGRIVRVKGEIAAIVEERDASPEERTIKEINAGVYAFNLEYLWSGLDRIAATNSQGEYYLTDLIRVFRDDGRTVATCTVDDSRSVMGVNNQMELAEAGRTLRERKNAALMEMGVTIVDPSTTFIDEDVTVGPETVIHPGTLIEGTSAIGRGCTIHGQVRLVNAKLDDGVTINNFTVIMDAQVSAGAVIGPFAHIRPGSDIGQGAKVGNFVELKKTVLGTGAKVNHLSYIGDAIVGERVNIGAGTITCNYDGEKKHQTVIDTGAFIGSGTELVAPVRVGAGAYVAAGSTITSDVPSEALGVARARQRNVAEWARRGRTRKG